MDAFRKNSLLITFGLLIAAVALGSAAARRAVSADDAAQLSGATQFLDSARVALGDARPNGRTDDELVVSLGYLERLRLGLGSPFRLVDQAMHDPRLGVGARRRVAWGIMDRLLRGGAYVIDPIVLDGVGPWRPDGSGATGEAHLRLIEKAVTETRDPRVGELSVRLAYQIAAAEGSVSSSGAALAAQAAALIRDRLIAIADVRELLRDSRFRRGDVIETVVARRMARDFDVERPVLAPLSSGAQVDAIRRVSGIVDAIRELGSDDSPRTFHASSLLGDRVAARLAVLGAELPPMAPVTITMRTQTARLIGQDSREGLSLKRAQMARASTNEETLVARYASITTAPDSGRRAPALAVMSTAIALRALAQSKPWFPGDAGPSAASMTTEFGLAAVSFDRRVPAAWRPYYLRELSSALTDLRDVLPGLSTAGLRVNFGVDTLPGWALAMHDPRGRVLRLSIQMSAGTIAHELAHDLDWQAARKLYAAGTGYSTDRAMREERGPLANSVRGLAGARIFQAPVAPGSVRPAERPTELFARGGDWFVASVLADRGRSNGFLSAIQDPLFSGYVAGPPSAFGLLGTQALVNALEQMTYLPETVRNAFLARWSNPATVDPMLSIRRVIETPFPEQWHDDVDPLTPPALSNLDAVLECAPELSSASLEARSRLVALAAEARARGIALSRARSWDAETRPVWAQSLLGVPPFAVESGERIVQRLRNEILEALGSAPADQGLVPSLPSIFRSSAASCSTTER